MLSSFQYPVFLSLVGQTCLVAGLGTVGCRKLGMLLERGAESVLVLDIRSRQGMSEMAARLLSRPGVCFETRTFTAADAKGKFLVFAATSDAAENSRIAAICASEGVPCNCATNPDEGSFILPAMARCAGFMAALSTSGASPLLARLWRDELEKWLEDKCRLAWLMGQIRPHVLSAGGTSSENRDCFQRIASSDVARWLETGDFDACQKWLVQNLPLISPDALRDIFAEYKNVFTS